MERIVFVTSNEGKVESARKSVNAAELVFYKYDLIEPRSESLEEIAAYKVMQAYEVVKEPCIAVDAGFYIEELNGWPSSFVNFNLNKLGLDGILKLLNNCDNRYAYFKECLAYYDGKNIQYFYGISKGKISDYISDPESSKQWSKLWKIFIPNNYDITLAEMTDEERNSRNDEHTSCFCEFNEYLKQKKLILK